MSATTVEKTDPTTTEPKPEPVEEPFDAARAKALIDKLRPFEDEAARLRKEIEKRDKAESAARDAKAIEDGKLGELAESRAARIAELEPQVATLTADREEAYTVIEKLVAEELKAAPDYVAEAIADKSAPAKLDFITEHRSKWIDRRGVPASDRPSNVRDITTQEQQAALNAQEARTRAAF